MNKKKYLQGTKKNSNEQATFNTHSIHVNLLGPYSLYQLMNRKPGTINKQLRNELFIELSCYEYDTTQKR